jgi:hypothetical protein
MKNAKSNLSASANLRNFLAKVPLYPSQQEQAAAFQM